jgi:hypothetical protein
MESSRKVQEQATRVKMGVNDLAFLAEEPGLMVFWMSIFKASWWLIDNISQDTSQLAHEVVIRKQAGGGVVVWCELRAAQMWQPRCVHCLLMALSLL